MTCPHGMPKPASCYECMEDGGLPADPAPAVSTVGRPLPAKFPGHCAGCNLAIHSGQSIIRMSDDSWQHSACAWDAAASRS